MQRKRSPIALVLQMQKTSKTLRVMAVPLQHCKVLYRHCTLPLILAPSQMCNRCNYTATMSDVFGKHTALPEPLVSRANRCSFLPLHHLKLCRSMTQNLLTFWRKIFRKVRLTQKRIHQGSFHLLYF